MRTRLNSRKYRPRTNVIHASLTTFTCLLLVVSFASTGRAQSTEGASPEPLPSRRMWIATLQTPPTALEANAAERAAELERWVEDFTAWIEWSSKWSNRREPGWFTSYRGRREKPTPPAWLPAQCETIVADDDTLASACALLADWQKDDAGLPIRSAVLMKTTAPEESPKTVWWERIHADLLWPAMQWQASVYGVIGMHTATTVRGRFEVFLAPGAMLLNVPSRSGTRVWKLAANYGMGYRLANFTFFGGRPAALHLNIARAWLLSDVTDVVTGRTTDFAGLSISFRKSQ